jgi:hypothetical protein
LSQPSCLFNAVELLRFELAYATNFGLNPEAFLLRTHARKLLPGLRADLTRRVLEGSRCVFERDLLAADLEAVLDAATVGAG